jgi:Outer membrane protein beta-barrel domain
MLRKILLLPVLLTTASAVAQTNFQPGYVVALAGDTLRGEVDARSAQRNASLIRFRTSPTAEPVPYQPAQLRGYGLADGQLYQTETILVAPPVTLETVGAPAPATPQAAFLEVVVQGAASLLYRRDQQGKERFYLRMSGQPVQELEQSTQQVEQKGTTYLRQTNQFRFTLAAAMRQCLALQPVINTTRYSTTGLTQLVQRYNTCIGSSYSTPADKFRQSPVRLVVMAGGERSTFQFNDARSFPTAGTTRHLNGGIQPVVGIALAIQPTKVSEAFSARIEALYESQRYAATFDNAFGVSTQYRVGLTSVRFPILVRYTYPKGKLRPFVQAGYCFAYLSEAKNEFRNQYTTGSNEWQQLVAPRKLEQGIVGSVGLATARARQRNLALEVRYEYSDGFSDTPAYGMRVKRGYLLLSYDLTR